jgi:RNA polymerase sigma-70 factor (ECF subfamily)
MGRFQLEAAIQSVHSERARRGRTDWEAIALFYEHLLQLAPTLGAQVARAAAMAEARGPSAALILLDAIDRSAVASYQPYWAVRAHVTRILGRAHEALEAYDRAIGLTEDPAIRQFLLERRG